MPLRMIQRIQHPKVSRAYGTRPLRRRREKEAATEVQTIAGIPAINDTSRPANRETIAHHAQFLRESSGSDRESRSELVQRLQDQYGNRYVQRVLDATRTEENASGQVAPEIEDSIRLARGGGQPLDQPVRRQLESTFGAGLDHVRVHTDSHADALNRALSAHAFTVDNDIFFRQGAYNPGATSGRELIAHETTHVIQQGSGAVRTKLVVNEPGDKYEEEADATAKSVIQAERLTMPTAEAQEEKEKAPAQLQRQPEDEGEEANMKLQRQADGEEEESTQMHLHRPSEEEDEKAQTLVQKKTDSRLTTVIQRADEASAPAQTGTQQSSLATLHALLDQFNVPEDQVINLLPRLNTAEKQTVIDDPWYKQRMVKALSFNEMSRAMTNLKPQLWVALDWLKAAAVATRAIDYYEIKPFIVAAPLAERQALNTPYWRSVFIKVCTNQDIVEAVTDLGLHLHTQLSWIDEEVASARISLTYADIEQLVKDAPQNQRDALKTDGWRDFFMKVCDNATIVSAVKDLNFEPRRRIEWILEEGNTDYLLGGGIDARQIYEALHDVLKGDALTFIELASLNKWRPEEQKRLREIMDSHRATAESSADKGAVPSEKEPGDEAKEFTKKTDSSAAQLIERYTFEGRTKEGMPIYTLRSKDLALDLAKRLTSEPTLVRQVLDTLTVGPKSHLVNKDDDVAVMILEVIPDDKQLRKIAQSAEGRAVLLAMVRKLFKGINLRDEEKQQSRVMQAVSDVDTQNRKGAAREVEVITFLYGGKMLDKAGETLGGFRGHTALVVGNLVYSFEAGWSCGYTKAGYMHANEYRDAIGQVLEVSEEDAKILQTDLNGSCGKSVYFVLGDICTGKASRALQRALDQKLYEVENPQLFVGYLESTGLVKGRNFYPMKAGATH